MIPEQMKCPECGASFSTPMEFERHNVTVHSRYTCVTCGQTFHSDDELNAHNLEEHPEKIPAD